MTKRNDEESARIIGELLDDAMAEKAKSKRRQTSFYTIPEVKRRLKKLVAEKMK